MGTSAIEIKQFDDLCVSFNSQLFREKQCLKRCLEGKRCFCAIYKHGEKFTDISGVIPNFRFVLKSDSGGADCGNPYLFCLPVIFALYVMQVCC